MSALNAIHRTNNGETMSINQMDDDHLIKTIMAWFNRANNMINDAKIIDDSQMSLLHRRLHRRVVNDDDIIESIERAYDTLLPYFAELMLRMVLRPAIVQENEALFNNLQGYLTNVLGRDGSPLPKQRYKSSIMTLPKPIDDEWEEDGVFDYNDRD